MNSDLQNISECERAPVGSLDKGSVCGPDTYAFQSFGSAQLVSWEAALHPLIFRTRALLTSCSYQR